MSKKPDIDDQLWSVIKSISARVDEFIESGASMKEGFEHLLGPALLISAVREMRKHGCSYEEAWNMVERAMERLQEEHENRRKGLRVVKDPDA